ncbi:MAG: LTA synthase family protein [Chitinophagaceae bacterium]|nr:LTA synthase family protein [Chitinophagaceae bacterium]
MKWSSYFKFRPYAAVTWRMLLMWFVVFTILRVFFVIYQWPLAGRIQRSSDFFEAFVAGIRLDLSTASMLILLPLLLANLYITFHIKLFKKIFRGVNILLLLVYTGIGLSDAGLYREWHAKINMQALSHFTNPLEVVRTVPLTHSMLFVVLLLALGFAFIYFFERWVMRAMQTQGADTAPQKVVRALLFFILSGGIGFVLIRGNVTGMPMNQSIAYFSNDVLANDIAVNPFYNILQDISIKNNIPDQSVYMFRSNEEALKQIQTDYPVTEMPGPELLNVQRPNLVFIFLESWTSDHVGVLGGMKDCTPQFDALSAEGLLFTRAYANAYVSDQGIPAVLSAYPSVSRVAITNQPAKVPLLPCITEELKQVGYESAFLFGGDLVYGNLRGYMLEKGFDELIEDKDLDDYPSGRLGVHDEYTFEALGKVLKKRKQPFIQGMFTQSTHMPYDFVPSDDWHSTPNNPEKLFTESMHYADIHLGRFFDSIKKEKLYENTLFIVVSDHSHQSIISREGYDPERHRIAMLMLGGALRKEWKGQRWEKIVSQLDIPVTLFRQMQVPGNRYPWSRNMMSPSHPSSAYFIYYGGVGYICNEGYCSSMQFDPMHLYTSSSDTSQAARWRDKALSFQQLVYENVRLRK